MALRGEVDVWARSQSLSLRYRAASSLYTREPLGSRRGGFHIRPLLHAPIGASALGGAQRAPPSSKAGPLVRFNAPLGH